MMTNAKLELSDFLSRIGKSVDDIEWARIAYAECYDPKLIVDYPTTPLLPALDFEYDSGYGTQYIHGAVVFKDGTWLTRSEYDGSEWWSYNYCPKKEQYNYESDLPHFSHL